jgi:LysR family transcriptional regulator for metE and metH
MNVSHVLDFPNMELEIRHLRLISAIAATGSVTKAAELLHLTQSALSHQLRDIEDRLKTSFFVRLGRRMLLTPAGERVLESARRVLDEVQRAEEDVHRLAGGGEGTIRVCTECNTGYHWLPPLLTVFRRRHPNVGVNVLADATSRPVQALLNGELDLAVLSNRTTDRALRIRPLFEDEMVAIVSPRHPFAQKTWVTPRELADEHLLLYTSVPEESFVLRKVLGPAGLVPRRLSFIMLTEAMIELARAGIGVGVLPRWSGERAISSKAVVPISIGRRGVHRQWTAATLRARPEPAYLTDFIDLIAERAAPARARQATA